MTGDQVEDLLCVYVLGSKIGLRCRFLRISVHFLVSLLRILHHRNNSKLCKIERIIATAVKGLNEWMAAVVINNVILLLVMFCCCRCWPICHYVQYPCCTICKLKIFKGMELCRDERDFKGQKFTLQACVKLFQNFMWGLFLIIDSEKWYHWWLSLESLVTEWENINKQKTTLITQQSIKHAINISHSFVFYLFCSIHTIQGMIKTLVLFFGLTLLDLQISIFHPHNKRQVGLFL